MKVLNELKLTYTKSKFKQSKIDGAESAYQVIKEFYSDDISIYESFFILLLNRANVTTGFAKISQGGTAGTVIDIKLIAKYAIESLSESIILAHNHPSGNLKPSQQDLQMTTKVKQGLNMLDVKVLDHLILSADGFYSLADNGHC